MPSLWKVAGAWCTNKVATDLKEKKKDLKKKNKEKKTFANGGSLVSDLARRLFFFFFNYYSSPSPFFFLFVYFFFIFSVLPSKHWLPLQRFFHRFLMRTVSFTFPSTQQSPHWVQFSFAFNHLSSLLRRDRASQIIPIIPFRECCTKYCQESCLLSNPAMTVSHM